MVRRFLQPQDCICGDELIQQFRHRQFPSSNPLANALVVVVGALVIAVSFVLGVVALAAFLAAAVVMAAVIGIRVWWLNRKAVSGRKNHANNNGKRQSGAEIIEGEFRIVDRDRDRNPGQ